MSSPGRDLTCHARRIDFATGQARMCGRPTGLGSLLCGEHECIVDGCSKVRQEDNPYCFVHKPAPKAFCDGNNCSAHPTCSHNKKTHDLARATSRDLARVTSR